MKRSFALVLSAATALTGTVMTSGTAAAAAPPEFGPCPEDIAEPHPQMRCAVLDIPVDHADPSGEKLELMISKLPARDPDARRGSLLVNPGGPGGPGIAFAGSLSEQLPPEVLDSYDLIGFDTRHTAHSTPISCVDAGNDDYWQHPLPDPDSPRDREQNWQRAQEYADGCAERAGQYLPHLNTRSNAQDMDLVRQALGEQRISFLGYSYGTYLGAVYGEMFPDRVDRMVLDSSVNPDPSEVWYRNNLSQDVAAQHRLGHFFDWVARYDDVFHLGIEREQVKQAWDGIQQQLREGPRGPLGPSEFLDITFNALYGESAWPDLARALADFHNTGDDRALVDQVTPMDAEAENSNAIYNAVECADAPWPHRRAEWERDSAELAEKYPMAAWYNSWTFAPCRVWDAPSQQPMKITGNGLPPVLMFNSEHDVATPYEGAQEMHRSLPSSVLVTERDAGKHGVFALAGNDKADRIGADYLTSGALPPGDVDVPAHPEPDPTAEQPPEGAQLR